MAGGKPFGNRAAVRLRPAGHVTAEAVNDARELH
jgi:hypothetical protein